VLDDIPIIAQNTLVRSLANVPQIFSTDYWSGAGATASDPGLYRPLTILTYALNYSASGLSPAAFHATNVALHAATALVVFLFAIELFGSASAAFVAAALFAVHPIHTEAVTGIVGRAEILASLFVMLALWFGRRVSVASAVGVGVFYLLALFSKESAATLPALFVIYDWTRRDPAREDAPPAMRALAPRYIALAVALIVYLAFRFNAVKQPGTSWDGWIGVPAFARVFTASRVLLEYLGLFAWPRTLLADYSASDVRIARSLGDAAVLLSFAVWIALIAAFATKWRSWRVLFFSVAWFFITVLPASNLLFASGLGKAERILYLPSIGLCLVVACLFLQLETRPQIRRIALTVVLPIALIALGARTLKRNEDWRDNLTLARASLAVSPGSATMNDLAGIELVQRGSPGEATPLLERAVREAPEKALFHTHLGSAYYGDKQPERAVAQYNTALRLSPRDADALNNLGVVFLDRQDLNRALTLFNGALSAAPNHAGAHTNRGLVYLAAGRPNEATQDFRAAIDIDPANVEAHNSLGVAYGRSGRLTEAAAEFREALRLRPDYSSARTNLNAVLNAGGANRPR
jgi:Tfp pilus assembly protein PilF